MDFMDSRRLVGIKPTLQVVLLIADANLSSLSKHAIVKLNSINISNCHALFRKWRIALFRYENLKNL